MDALIAATGKQSGHGPAARNGDVRSDLGQGREHKGPLVHARMRQGEFRVVLHRVAMEEQIQVQGAGSILDAAPAPEMGLDGEEFL